MEPQRDMQALGETLRAAREVKGLSARRLAAASGLTHSFISKLESATYDSVSPDSLMALAQALDVAPADLFTLAGFSFPMPCLHLPRTCGLATARSCRPVPEQH